MANVVVEVEALVVGKELKKASEEWVNKDGKTISAQPERYYVYFALGSLYKNCELLRGKPCIKEAKISKETFESLSDVQFTRITLDLVDSFENYRTKIIGCEDIAVLE